MQISNVTHRLTVASIWSVLLFSFVSLSASALSHILIFIPAVYGLILQLKKQDQKIPLSMYSIFILIFVSCVSVLVAPDIENKLSQMFKLKYFALGALAVFPYRKAFKKIKKEHVRLMINTFLIILAIGNIAGIHALFDGYHILRMKEASDSHRAAGMYGMAITYGYGIEYIVIIAMSVGLNYWSKLDRILNKKIFVISAITCVLGFYFSFARGAVVAFVLSIPFVFLMTKRKYFKVLLVGGFVLLLGLTYIVFNVDDIPGGNRLLLSAKTESNMIRISQYETVWKAFLEKPFTGWGFRNFEHNVYHLKTKYNIAYPEFMSHAHNNYLEFLAGTGIFGFISFTLFIIFWFYEVYRRRDDISVIFLPFIVSLAVSGLFQNTITDGENMFVIMFIYALTQAYPRDKKVFA